MAGWIALSGRIRFVAFRLRRCRSLNELPFQGGKMVIHVTPDRSSWIEMGKPNITYYTWIPEDLSGEFGLTCRVSLIITFTCWLKFMQQPDRYDPAGRNAQTAQGRKPAACVLRCHVLQRRAEYSDGAELLPGHVSTGRAVRNYRLKADPPFSGGMCHKTDYNNSKSPAISV